jgi:hypothetical protein
MWRRGRRDWWWAHLQWPESGCCSCTEWVRRHCGTHRTTLASCGSLPQNCPNTVLTWSNHQPSDNKQRIMMYHLSGLDHFFIHTLAFPWKPDIDIEINLDRTTFKLSWKGLCMTYYASKSETFSSEWDYVIGWNFKNHLNSFYFKTYRLYFQMVEASNIQLALSFIYRRACSTLTTVMISNDRIEVGSNLWMTFCDENG